MTYIDLINRFWELYRVKKFSDIDTVVYFFLLNECNIRKWLNPFELQTRNLEVNLGISRKTIGEARNRIKQRGLINFVEAQGRGPTTYLLEDVEVNNDVLKTLFCISPTKHEGNTNGNTKVTQRLHKGNTTPNSTSYIEDLRVKTKEERKEKKESSTQRFSEGSLFSPKELNRTILNKRSNPPPKFPTLEEVKEHFLSVDAPSRIENWEQSAIRFYENYDAVGWIDKYGRRITRWDSRANSWISADEEKLKKSKQDGKETDRNGYVRRHVAADTYEERQRDIMQYVADNLGKD